MWFESVRVVVAESPNASDHDRAGRRIGPYRHQHRTINRPELFVTPRHRTSCRSRGKLRGCPLDEPAAMVGATVAVVLAAGAGTRFRGPGHKLDARLDGRSVLDRAVGTALAAGHRSRRRRDRRPDRARRCIPAVVHVVNDRWAEGQVTSLQAGHRRRAPSSAPLRSSSGSATSRSSPSRRGGPSPPPTPRSPSPPTAAGGATRSGCAGDVWDLLPAAGDEGARAVMRLRPDLVAAVPCVGSPIDIDTVEDLRRWQNNSSTSSP